jgi:hypothetical protein
MIEYAIVLGIIGTAGSIAAILLAAKCLSIAAEALTLMRRSEHRIDILYRERDRKP